MLRKFVFLFVLPFLLFGREKVDYKPLRPGLTPPWLTGPLLAPAAHVVPGGHFNIEPYIFAIAVTGNYNSHWENVGAPTFWQNYFQPLVEVGILSWLDMQISPTVYWNYTQHTGHWEFGDLPLTVDIQLFSGVRGGWIPAFKLILKETIPTGEYRNLNPQNKGTDVGGGGSWNTQIGLVIGHLHHLVGVHYLSYRLAMGYNFPAPTRLKGFNAYGGGYGTSARFFPAQAFTSDLAFEVTLSQSWAFALDLVGSWAGKTHYTGFKGTTASGTPAKLGSKSSVSFNLAPAIEYNWSQQLGMIGGAWISVAGRNSQVFRSGVIALDYYY